ncbi:MAG: hypothetical protein UR21_C0016G0015 [Candidatus Woesebacteria bacterium GW2011_GWC2_31_9]|uniref:Uncharacterized protein n=1 Tax=Candidatus Woesebacteria bacterium GW2011_GWC2_31_9 TaxID=1618586 RepID=A0A0G0BJA6_9BACT|nr:MAG: hypothetical protein UR21_C0016G0015 [Candidatus Woesebacteria bacterium GW2011_GWC2_31_9]
MNLKNKIAVVTGASDGIGKEVCLKLAKEGVSLALIARDEGRLNEVKNKCIELGSPKVEGYICDISDNEKVKEAVNKILVDFNGVNILLNIAGVWQKLNLLENIPDEEIDSVIDIDLKGMIYVTKLFLKHFEEKADEESIILKQNIYTAAKWGVTGFSESLKADLKGSKIKVATVYQGGTNTELFNKTGEHFNQDKFINPSDLADTIVFMLSRPSQIWLHDVRVEY